MSSFIVLRRAAFAIFFMVMAPHMLLAARQKSSESCEIGSADDEPTTEPVPATVTVAAENVTGPVGSVAVASSLEPQSPAVNVTEEKDGMDLALVAGSTAPVATAEVSTPRCPCVGVRRTFPMNINPRDPGSCTWGAAVATTEETRTISVSLGTPNSTGRQSTDTTIGSLDLRCYTDSGEHAAEGQDGHCYIAKKKRCGEHSLAGEEGACRPGTKCYTCLEVTITSGAHSGARHLKWYGQCIATAELQQQKDLTHPGDDPQKPPQCLSDSIF